MMTMVSPEYIKMAAERTARIKEAIGADRFINVPEEQIKDAIIRRYDLTPAYAQNFPHREQQHGERGAAEGQRGTVCAAQDRNAGGYV